MNNLTTAEKIKILKTGETLDCPKCGGKIKAVGEPKTASVFRCDGCGASMVPTIK